MPKNNYSVGSIGDVAVAVGTSFVPFVDLVNIETLDLKDIPFILVFYTLFALVFGALKLFLLIVVIANFLPFWNV